MNRSERYRSRNTLSAKKKRSGMRVVPLLLLVLLFVALLVNPLSNVRDLAIGFPILSPLSSQLVVSDGSIGVDGGFGSEESADLSKTVTINSSIDDSNTVVVSSDALISPDGSAGGYGSVSGELMLAPGANYLVGGSVVEGRSDATEGEIVSGGVSGLSISSSNTLVFDGDSDYGVIVVSDGSSGTGDSFDSLSGNSARPLPGYIFEKSGEGTLPQLTVVAPVDQDAFVKLKDTQTGETMLSFYVRAGYTVKACVPVGYCDFFYVLGDGGDWLGPNNAFGENGVYAKADRSLNFTNPLNNYTYEFNVDNGNISPVTVSESVF